jgi:hypothetical protein
MSRYRDLGLGAGAALLAAACATPPVETAAARPDPRQGEEVNRVCFKSQVKSWSKNDNRSVIISIAGANTSMAKREDYKLELAGPCQPEDAFIDIGLRSTPGGGCIEPRVTEVLGSCVVKKIYKWDEAALGDGNSIGAARLASRY